MALFTSEIPGSAPSRISITETVQMATPSIQWIACWLTCEILSSEAQKHNHKLSPATQDYCVLS